MAASSLSLSSPSSSITHHHHHNHNHHRNFLFPPDISLHRRLRLRLRHSFPSLQAYRRNSSASSQDNDELINNGRRWSRFDFDGYDDDNEDDDNDEDEEEEDRSFDLLVKIVENVFRKVSKRARKAVRSVLPVSISTKLVGFAVNGLIILSFLWVLKAFLEVICTLGSVVFVSILLIRGVWSGLAYLQDGRGRHMNNIDDDQSAWTRAQPIT